MAQPVQSPLGRVEALAPAAPAVPPAERLPGLRAVVRKEIGDLVSGWRFDILAGLVAVAGLAALYVAAMSIRQSVGQSGTPDFVFLLLFTASDGKLPPFMAFISFLAPLVGIAMGFDAICGEQNQRTLSRLVAQPIYRDAIINGKFVAGVCTVAGMLLSLWQLVGGLGQLLTGVPPTLDEMLRLVAYFAVTVVYVSFWLALAILWSVVFRQAATSALASIAVWLFFWVFGDLLAELVAGVLAPVTDANDALQLLRNQQLGLALKRLSPVTLYNEAVVTLLTPKLRALGPVLLEQVVGAIDAPLPFDQSLLLVWPHVVGLVSATLICFAAAYVIFMRREIRA